LSALQKICAGKIRPSTHAREIDFWIASLAKECGQKGKIDDIDSRAVANIRQ
jgi:hypothetical protein